MYTQNVLINVMDSLSTVGCGQHHHAKLARRHQLIDPILELAQLDVEARRNHTTLVQTTVYMNKTQYAHILRLSLT